MEHRALDGWSPQHDLFQTAGPPPSLPPGKARGRKARAAPQPPTPPRPLASLQDERRAVAPAPAPVAPPPRVEPWPDPSRPWAFHIPKDGLALLDIEESGVGEQRYAVRSWHADGMRFDEPKPLTSNVARWTIPTDGLLFVSIRQEGTPGPGEHWYALRSGGIVETSQEAAYAWTPGTDVATLPALTGAAQQVRWASAIRLEYARRYPTRPVPTRTDADWWIRRRHMLGAD